MMSEAALNSKEKNSNAESYPFLVIDTALPSDNALRFLRESIARNIQSSHGNCYIFRNENLH